MPHTLAPEVQNKKMNWNRQIWSSATSALLALAAPICSLMVITRRSMAAATVLSTLTQK